MNRAPTLQEVLTEVQPPENLASNITVKVVACGGAGTNILKKFLLTPKHFDTEISYEVIDTSKSNISGIPPCIKFNAIGELGSGKDRAKNQEAIQKYIDNNTELSKANNDLTILIFSMAGGSGSVIAPLLAHRLLKNSNRAVILMGIVDVASLRDCENSINTLKTFSSMAEKHGYYFPLMMYNNTEVGRVAVNDTAIIRLEEIIDMLTSNRISEVDHSDKMNFLKPNNMNCPNGVYLLSVTNTTSDKAKDLAGEFCVELDKGDSVHACFVVNATGITPNILTNFTYVGISDDKTYFSTIGHTVPKYLINNLNEIKERYNEQSIVVDTTATALQHKGTTTSSGIIV